MSERVVPVDKHITNELYDAMKEAGYRWNGEEYGYHLGRVQNMLKNDNPTDEELADLPDALTRLYQFQPKADAPAALRELRRQKKRAETLQERMPVNTADPALRGWNPEKESIAEFLGRTLTKQERADRRVAQIRAIGGDA